MEKLTAICQYHVESNQDTLAYLVSSYSISEFKFMCGL